VRDTKIYEGGFIRMATPDSRRWRDIPFHELEPGTTRRSHYALDQETVAGFSRLLDSSRQPAPAVGASVPSAVYSSFLPIFRALGGRMEQGTIHTHQSITVYSPAARVGDMLDAEVTVVSADAEGPRRRVEIRTVFSHCGRQVCTTRSRYLWGFSAPDGAAR
jgi:hypothetical protein